MQQSRSARSFANVGLILQQVVEDWLDYSSVPSIRACSSSFLTLPFKSFALDSLRSSTAYSYIMERAWYVLVRQEHFPETPHWQLTQDQAAWLNICGGCLVWHVELEVEHAREAEPGEDPRDRDEDLGDRLQLWQDERGRLTHQARILETHRMSRKVKMVLEPDLETRFKKSAEDVMDLLVHDQRNPIRWGGTRLGGASTTIYARLPGMQPDHPLLGPMLDGLGYQMATALTMSLEETATQLSRCNWKDLPTRSYELPPGCVLLTATGVPRLLPA